MKLIGLGLVALFFAGVFGYALGYRHGRDDGIAFVQRWRD